MKLIPRLFVILVAGQYFLTLHAAAPVVTMEEQRLAVVLILEAGGEGRAGMEAVAETVLNRQKLSKDSLTRVLNPGAFASLQPRTWSRSLLCARKHARWPLALQIARTAVRTPSKLPSRVYGAEHFDHKAARPWWARGRKPVVIIKNHAFYHLGEI